MHKRAKRVGLKPSYSIKHPTIKVELQNNRKIETDKYKTISMDYEHFEFICRYVESNEYILKNIWLSILIDHKLESLERLES